MASLCLTSTLVQSLTRLLAASSSSTGSGRAPLTYGHRGSRSRQGCCLHTLVQRGALPQGVQGRAATAWGERINAWSQESTPAEILWGLYVWVSECYVWAHTTPACEDISAWCRLWQCQYCVKSYREGADWVNSSACLCVCMVNEDTQNSEPGQTGFRKAGFPQVIIEGLIQSQWFDQEMSQNIWPPFFKITHQHKCYTTKIVRTHLPSPFLQMLTWIS